LPGKIGSKSSFWGQNQQILVKTGEITTKTTIFSRKKRQYSFSDPLISNSATLSPAPLEKRGVKSGFAASYPPFFKGGRGDSVLFGKGMLL
jgi:hypothetical protein